MTTMERCDLDRREEDRTWGPKSVGEGGQGRERTQLRIAPDFSSLRGHHSLKSGARGEQIRAPSGLKFKSQQPTQSDSLHSKSEIYPGL